MLVTVNYIEDSGWQQISGNTDSDRKQSWDLTRFILYKLYKHYTIEICSCSRLCRPYASGIVRHLLSHDCFSHQSSSGPTRPGSYDGVLFSRLFPYSLVLTIVSMIVPVKSLTSSRSRRPPNVFVELHYLQLASYSQSTQTLLQYQIIVLCRRTGTSKAVQLRGH